MRRTASTTTTTTATRGLPQQWLIMLMMVAAIMLTSFGVQAHILQHDEDNNKVEGEREKTLNSRSKDDTEVKKNEGEASEGQQRSKLRPIQLLTLHYEGDDHHHHHHHDHDGHHHHHDHDGHHHHHEHHHTVADDHHDDDDHDHHHHDIDESIYSSLSVKERIHDPLEDPEEPETAFFLDDEEELYEQGRGLEGVDEDGEPIQYGRRCSASPPTPDEEAEQKQVTAKYLENRRRGRFLHSSESVVQVPVYWHIMLKNDKGNGNVTTTQVLDTMKVLNEAFKPHGFAFVLMGVQRVVNKAYFRARPSNAPGDEDAMKMQYRKGDATTLNVYTGQPGGGLLGWATFPSWLQRYDWGHYYDGVCMRFSTVVGGKAAPYNLGGTLIHEVGHWLGLYHTFQDGCNNNGDGITDTAFHSGPTHGCPTEAEDTCPNLPGKDPIRNYMNYLQDACMTEFTRDQGTEMRAQWCEYRGDCTGGGTTITAFPTSSPVKRTPAPSQSPVPPPVVRVTEIFHRIVRTGIRSWKSRVVVHADQPGVLVTCNFHNQIQRQCRTNSRNRCFCGSVEASNRLPCYDFFVDKLMKKGHIFDSNNVASNYRRVCL